MPKEYFIKCESGPYAGDILNKDRTSNPTLDTFAPMSARMLKTWYGSFKQATLALEGLNDGNWKFEIYGRETTFEILDDSGTVAYKNMTGDQRSWVGQVVKGYYSQNQSGYPSVTVKKPFDMLGTYTADPKNFRELIDYTGNPVN